MSNDTRPRVNYRLPNGRIVPVIFDHGERQPDAIQFTLEGGVTVRARKDPA